MGFFNLSQDEQARIDAMPGTSEVPPAGALEGLATAIPKGIAGAGVKVGTLLNDTEQAITGGLEKLGLHPGEPEPDMHRFGLDPIPEAEQRERSAAAVKVVTDWAATGQDPRVTGSVGRIAAGTAEGITIGVAGNEVAGPWGAAGLLGTAEGYSGYKETKAQGADDTTALEVGGLTGVFAAGSAFLPMKFGKTLAQSVLGGGVANVTLGAAQRGLTSEVLESHGYHEMASQYRIADGEAVAADLILGGAFGAFGHATSRRVNPADVDAASAVAAENHYNRSAPGVPTDPQTATAHADTMAGALHDLANGDLPNIPPERAQQLVDNVVPDPAHSWGAAQPIALIHGTNAEGKAAILSSGKFDLSAGKRQYNYSELGPDAIYLTHEGSHWTNQEEDGRKIVYKHWVRAELSPEAKVFHLRTAEDEDTLTKLLGFENPHRMGWAFFVDGLTDGPEGVQRANERYAPVREKLREAGIDALSVDKDFVPDEDRTDFTPGQVAVFNHAMLRVLPDEPAEHPLIQAAREELPGFESAAADIKPIEMAPEEVPPPKVEPEPVTGEPVKEPDVPLDDFHGSMLDHLVHNYGDERYVTEDGREVSYREMANEMQAQRNEADAFSKLHDVAAACAARNGV